MVLKKDKIENIISFINNEEPHKFIIHDNISKNTELIKPIEENTKKGLYYCFLISMPIFIYKTWTQINTNKKEHIPLDMANINVYIPNIINNNDTTKDIKKNIKKSISIYNNINELYNNDILSSIILPQCLFINFYEYGTHDDYKKLIWEFEKKIINTYDNELLKNYIDNIKNISS